MTLHFELYTGSSPKDKHVTGETGKKMERSTSFCILYILGNTTQVYRVRLCQSSESHISGIDNAGLQMLQANHIGGNALAAAWTRG